MSSVSSRIEREEMEKISTQRDGSRDERAEDSVDVAEKGVGVLSGRRGDALRKSVTALDWDGPDDPENPQNWPLWQQVYHTYVVFGVLAFLSLCEDQKRVTGRDLKAQEFGRHPWASANPGIYF